MIYGATVASAERRALRVLHRRRRRRRRPRASVRRVVRRADRATGNGSGEHAPTSIVTGADTDADHIAAITTTSIAPRRGDAVVRRSLVGSLPRWRRHLGAGLLGRWVHLYRIRRHRRGRHAQRPRHRAPGGGAVGTNRRRGDRGRRRRLHRGRVGGRHGRRCAGSSVHPRQAADGTLTEVLLVRSEGQLYRVAYVDGGEPSSDDADDFVDSFHLR